MYPVLHLFSMVKTVSLDGRLLLGKMAASGRGVVDGFIRHNQTALRLATQYIKSSGRTSIQG